MSGCRRIEPWIVRSVDGDLAPSEALRLARHLAECTSCRIVVARETRLATLLHGVEDECAVDESFFAAVMASLPDRPLRNGASTSRRERRRRGLRLAGLGSVVALSAGLAARVLPSLRLDVATPALPRFVPDDTAGWISWIGSATQWIQVTAESIAWVGSSGSQSAWTIGTLSLMTALVGGVTLLAVSGALAWASRAGSRAS
jgi:hypothetical protein